MIYEKATGLFIPVFYVLLPTKHQECYKHALVMIELAVGQPIGVSTFTCDFEKGMINNPDSNPNPNKQKNVIYEQ